MGVINNVKALISTSKLTNLANAIRNKTGEVESYTVDEMIEKINGMGSSVLTSLNVTTNGIYTPPSGFDGFDSVNVNVPSNLVLIDTVEVNGVNGIQTDINMSWFDTYDYVVMVPNLTFSTSDYLYVIADGTDFNNSYTEKVRSVVPSQALFLNRISNVVYGAWNNGRITSGYKPTSYLYWRIYYSNSTMTGTIKIYGVKLT